VPPVHVDGGSSRERWALWILAVVAVACPLACALVATDVVAPLRAGAVVVMFVLAPGAAVLGRRAAEPGLVVGVSLALDAIAAQCLLWTNHWAPTTATYVLAAACFPVLVFQLLRHSGRRAPVGLEA